MAKASITVSFFVRRWMVKVSVDVSGDVIRNSKHLSWCVSLILFQAIFIDTFPNAFPTLKYRRKAPGTAIHNCIRWCSLLAINRFESFPDWAVGIYPGLNYQRLIENGSSHLSRFLGIGWGHRRRICHGGVLRMITGELRQVQGHGWSLMVHDTICSF